MDSKKKKRTGNKRKGVMGRSDIPYAQRLKMQQHTDIVVCRNHSAKIAMFCACVALHEKEGIGYKRLTNYSSYYMTVLNDFYEDIDVGMAHAKRRMELLGMPISGEFYTEKMDGLTKREQEVHDHSMQAVQIALLCNAVAMNDFFGFGHDRQERVSERISELTDRYAKEGEGFLLTEMAKIGFPIVDGTVVAYADEDGKAVMPSRARKEARAQDGKT